MSYQAEGNQLQSQGSAVRPTPQNHTSLHWSLPTGERSPAVFLQVGGKPTFREKDLLKRPGRKLLKFSGCCRSAAKLCLTLWDTVDCSMPGFPIFHYWLELLSIKLVMQSSHLILCCPLLLLHSIYPSIRVFSSELALSIKWPKCWTFSFSISPSNEYSGLISFRTEWHLLLTPYKAESRVWVNHAEKRTFWWGEESLQKSLAKSWHLNGDWDFPLKRRVVF